MSVLSEELLGVDDSTAALSPLIDAHGVDHRPPAPLRLRHSCARWSRVAAVVAILCVGLALASHWRAEQRSPERSAAATQLLGMWTWGESTARVADAVHEAREGRRVDPWDLMVQAAPPMSNFDREHLELQDRVRTALERGGRYDGEADLLVAEWDLAMFELMLEEGISVENRSVEIDRSALLGDDRYDAARLMAEVWDAEWEGRTRALEDYGDLSAEVRLLVIGQWVAGCLAVFGAVAAALLRVRAVRGQWGSAQRYSLARKEHRRLSRRLDHGLVD